MIQILFKLPRRYKQALMLLFDVVAVISSLFAAFSIRLGVLYYPTNNDTLLLLMFASPILALPIFIQFGLYREVIRYVGFKAIWNTNQATTLYSILWGLIAFMAIPYISGQNYFPRSVVLINWFIVLIAIGGSRLFARWILTQSSKNNIESHKNNVIIYGAGSAGRQLSNALKESNEYLPVAFIDDNIESHQHSINGLAVYSRDDIKYLIKLHDVKEVLLAIPSISRANRREVIDFLEPLTVVVRSLPSVSELAKGRVTVNDLLEIDISDLLGRETAKPNATLLRTNITKKVVLVTGAGGSIGSELCRQILLLNPKKLILFDISESSLYKIEQRLLEIRRDNIEIFPIIGSTSDKNRMEYICTNFGVKTIYHAAAYKHVPLVEFNQSQGVLNNAIGTLVAAKAAISSDVETFVLVSTDKAVRPTNVMGASKRISELILQALDKEHPKTCFAIVRFGNVLDSSGSVIPLFKKQIKSGGPVTVTHSDVVRYFMTIPEAVELVIQAGAMSNGGEIFVLDMGEPVRIYDLAVKMIQLSGLEVIDENNPKGDIEIKYTGLRPGEKLYEELLLDGDFTTTENKLIMCTKEEMIDWDQLEPMLSEIEETSKNVRHDSDNEKIYTLLRNLVPQFDRKSSVFDKN